MSYTNLPLDKKMASHLSMESILRYFHILWNCDPGPISYILEVHLLFLSNPFGPAIINGFLKSRFICLLKAWKMLDGLVGKMKEKLAD